MTTYAISTDLTISFVGPFSSRENEIAWDLTEEELMSQHPHAVALSAALKSTETKFDYRVAYASAHRDIRICLTCKNPDEEQSYIPEMDVIIGRAGLSTVDGIADESGDHALVG
jgi:hypothetical protein